MTTVQYAHNGTVRIAYERFGNAGGEPLLFINGLGRNMLWIPDGLCHTLVAHGFDVVRYDHRDSGLSTHFDHHTSAPHLGSVIRASRTPPYPLTALADDAVAVLDALDWDSANLVGGSMGAGVALLTAVRAPARVRSLTLTTAAYLPGAAKVFRHINPRILLGLGGRKFGKDEEGEAEMTAAVMRMLASPHVPFDADAARDIGRRSFRRRPFDPQAERRQLSAGRSDQTWAFDRLPDVPIQVINGLDDPIVRAAGGLELARRLRAQIRFYPGMGHNLPEHLWETLADDVHTLTADARSSPRSP
ncbi:alpha/beta fold hydrolase [Catenuloplanes japonicus]|uniref:alpha/beta fold hydrolase n=1 Tax=Catenuloplanes japonicus TaxID=33876 RepID=UPI000527E7E5|nr:alpha/beta hydrolase [Catenuloplanes japonicus]